MSRQSTKTRPAGWENQHGSAGASSNNPSDRDYQQKFDDRFNNIAGAEKQLSDLEKSWNAPFEGKNGANVGLRENEINPVSTPGNQTAIGLERARQRFSRESLKQVFTGKNIENTNWQQFLRKLIRPIII